MYNSRNFDALPSGWDMQYDTQTNRYYFINHNDRTTTWKDPRPQDDSQNQGTSIPVHHEISNSGSQSHIQVQANQNSCLNVPVSNNTAEKRSRSPSPYAITSLDQIKRIMHDVEHNIKPNVDIYEGVYKDKQYLFLEDQLEKRILRLDSVESDGDEEVRQQRKSTIKLIQELLSSLESRAKSRN